MQPLGLVFQIAIAVTELLLVDIVSVFQDAAGAYDGNIQAAEVEATAENVVSVIHNQVVTFGHVTDKADSVMEKVKKSEDSVMEQVLKSENSTQTVVKAAAGDN
jgi:hypothetical protein